MTKISIDGEEYTLDVKHALVSGVLKPTIKLITDISVGDVFGCQSAPNFIIILKTYNNKWFMGGSNGLYSYSNFADGVSKQTIIDYLNSRKREFIKNINEDLKYKIFDIINKRWGSKDGVKID